MLTFTLFILTLQILTATFTSNLLIYNPGVTRTPLKLSKRNMFHSGRSFEREKKLRSIKRHHKTILGNLEIKLMSDVLGVTRYVNRRIYSNKILTPEITSRLKV